MTTEAVQAPTHWFEFDGNPNRYFCVWDGQTLGHDPRVHICQDTITPGGRLWKEGARLIVSRKRLVPVGEGRAGG